MTYKAARAPKSGQMVQGYLMHRTRTLSTLSYLVASPCRRPLIRARRTGPIKLLLESNQVHIDAPVHLIESRLKSYQATTESFTAFL